MALQEMESKIDEKDNGQLKTKKNTSFMEEEPENKKVVFCIDEAYFDEETHGVGSDRLSPDFDHPQVPQSHSPIAIKRQNHRKVCCILKIINGK